MTVGEWNELFIGHWNFSGAKQDNHLAMFPEELPRRLIKMFAFAGEVVRLSNGLEVRLIGIRENPAQNGKASDWLREKTKGQKVFLKFDAVKHDADNRIMAYIYLTRVVTNPP